MMQAQSAATPKWQKITRLVIAVICGLTYLLGALAFKFGAFFNLAFLLICAGCLIVPLMRLPYLIQKEIYWHFWKAPFASQNIRYWRPILLRVAFWGLCATTVYFGLPLLMLTSEELKVVYFLLFGGVTFLTLLSLIPKRVGGKPMSIFSAFAIPAMVFILGDSLFPQLSGRDAIAVNSPFLLESRMAHAGHNTMVNYHVAHISQKHALDMMSTNEEGYFLTGNRTELESYACFGATLIAPVTGEAVIVVRDQIDQPIGSRDPKNPAGNQVVIKMDETHYALLAHMKQDSATVSVGDWIEVGQKLGECGNSGNTTAPHLHFQIQRTPDLFAADGFTYPIKFNNTSRIRRGKRVQKNGLFYIRNDRMVPNN